MTTTKSSAIGAARVPRPSATLNRAVRTILHSPILHHLIEGSVCELRLRGRRSGDILTFPVQYARYGGDVVVLVGASARKSWWRNFTTPYPVQVRIEGTWRPGVGRAVGKDSAGRPAAVRAYRNRFPKVTIADADPFIVVTLLPTHTVISG